MKSSLLIAVAGVVLTVTAAPPTCRAQAAVSDRKPADSARLAAAEYACNNGVPSGATSLATARSACNALGGVWFPDLVKSEAFLDFDI